MRQAGAAGLLCAALICGCGGGGGRSSSSNAPTATVSATDTSAQATHSATDTSTQATVSATNTSALTSRPTLARGFHLVSPAFRPGGPIPARFSCRGADTSPPLAISGVPAGTRELVLVMRDPDAPGGDFVHWALAGIPPSVHSLAAGGVPGLVAPGRNSFGSLGYRGPCPPRGPVHHYVLTLTALSAHSGLRAGFSPDALTVPAIGIATLIGTFRG